jgi:hypothetical protein
VNHEEHHIQLWFQASRNKINKTFIGFKTIFVFC